MRALRLIQLLKTNSAVMSDELARKIRASGKCEQLLLKVPDGEQRQDACQIYQALTEWLADETDSILEHHYVALGIRRAGQGVPLSQMFWALSIAREYLWEYAQQECFHEEPVEFLGGVTLLRALNNFFDQIFYFALAGYEKARGAESAAFSFLSSRRSA